MLNKVLGIILVSTLVACSSSTTPPPPPAPYEALPLDSLSVGTKLYVRGNGTGWWDQTGGGTDDDAVNQNGPKLQRLDATGTPGVYDAVFRNNNTNVYYGTATITMPAEGGVVSATTDLGYPITLTRVNDTLIYTLTGLFTIARGPNAPGANRLAHGGFVAGSYTAPGDLPQSGVYVYQGVFIGSSNIVGIVNGDVELTADFGAGAGIDLTGDITNVVDSNNDPFRDISIQALIDNATGDFTGVANIGIDGAAGPNAFPGGADGIVDGGFYGPNGEEIGGTLRVKDGEHFLTGAFGGAQLTPP